MLVDLALKGKSALIIGRGDEVRIRADQFVEEGARVTILTDEETKNSNHFRKGKLEIRQENLSRWKFVLQKIRPFVVVVSTRYHVLDEKIAGYARTLSHLVYVVDRPQLNDINMTGVAKLGDVRVAVSTQGLSPAMAGILRRKIESIIAPEDILLVKLQGEVRSTLKKQISDPERRKKLVYRLIRDKKTLSFLKSKRFEEARTRALEIIAANSKIV
ncbi:MAG: bifunctional precorrin-2 dehydrogenase/sirohydrochlorin ferrochelatase [Thaumarchaeota archaeon]|nr:bifunctional precorrin-2 dehydrogenase/sirohydrochlorin ferrochelatase [Nitrososphaerota archaeon]